MLAKTNVLRLVTVLILMLCISSLSAQKKVSGKVSDPNGQPVSGATVNVKGTTTNTTTSVDGDFSISIPTTSKVLVFSSVGFSTQEVTVGNNTIINVSLTSTTSNLNEVVVIGYGTQKRQDITGSISSVGAAQIEKVPITTATQALQGRAAGVQIINNDASPGGNISVLIRGIGSLASGGNDPLYVIDGYPTTGGVNNINPSDIASIDVLKDASATSIYGIRAANGVVIITTKKGLANKTQVSFDMYEAAQSKPKQYNILNAFQFASLSNEVEAADSTKSYHGLPIWHTPSSLTSVDWQNALYRPALTQNYSVAVRGGSDKVQASASFGYYNQKGIVLGSYFKRYTTGFNLDFKPATWFKSATSIKFSNQNGNTPLGTGALYQLAVNPPTLDGGNMLTNQISDGKGNYGFYNPQNSSVFKFGNPVYGIATNQSTSVNNYLLANSSFEITPFNGLKIRSSVGINYSTYSGSYYQPEDRRAGVQYPGSITANAYYHQNQSTGYEWIWENTIAYDKTFGKHTINFLAGTSAQKSTSTVNGAGGIPPNGVIRDLGQLTNLTFDQYGNGQSINTLASTFARLTYQFDNKYFITGTVRRDGSSKFDTGHQYAVFPSGSIAWKIKNESFLRNVGWLNDLKIRAGYGEVGNQSTIPPFAYQAQYAGNLAATVNGGGNDNLGYPFNKIYQNGISQVTPANPDLKWETDVQTDIGFDASFMHGALTLTVDYYQRDSKDFLLTIPASPQTGYNYITHNVGAMSNKGIEFALNYNGNRGKDFHYSIGATVSSNKNTLTSITSGINALTSSSFGYGLTGQGWGDFSNSVIGESVGEFYGYKSLGIFQTQAQIDGLNNKAPGGIYYRAATKPGDRYFADINGDGVVNASDRTSIGSPQPKFFGGLNFDASYKAWDINLYFYGVSGNKVLNYIESDLESFQKRGSEGVENVSVAYYQNHWTPTNHSDRYARALANDDNTLDNVPSSAWVEDGSFLKLKNLTIGYTLPVSISSKFNLTKLRAYVSTQNLFTITKYSGLDPEIGIQNGNPIFNGVDNGTYPSSKYFTFGLNVTF